jgi:hypothetical protein
MYRLKTDEEIAQELEQINDLWCIH